jgi:hypothetical protein
MNIGDPNILPFMFRPKNQWVNQTFFSTPSIVMNKEPGNRQALTKLIFQSIEGNAVWWPPGLALKNIC